jgi:TRAP-type mannitol/chloroaromatic compound transport system substrate-binding protein
MIRGRVIGTAAALAAALGLAGPAPAQEKVRLNIQSVFGASFGLIGEAPVRLAKKVERASGGTLELRVYEPGALVPATQAIPATQQGSVDAAYAGAGWLAGTDTAFNMFSTVPFGPGIGEYIAWMYNGGGLALAREMFAKLNV